MRSSRGTSVNGSRPAMSAVNERRRKVKSAPSRTSSAASSVLGTGAPPPGRVSPATPNGPGTAARTASAVPSTSGANRLVGAPVDAQVVEAEVDPGQRPAGQRGDAVDGVLGLDQDAEAAAAGDRVERAVDLLGRAHHRQQDLVGAAVDGLVDLRRPSTGRSR